MKVFYSLSDFLKSRASLKEIAVTIGVFDGVHNAHQKIIRCAIKKAKVRHLSTLLITFDPHPANVLNPRNRVPFLISLKHRLYLLRKIGIEYVIVMRFTKRLSRMRAGKFIKTIFNKLRISEVIVGENFFFGRNKKGSLKDLRNLSKICRYRVTAIRVLRRSGKIISSTWIRNLILKGDLREASKLLSQPVTVLGTVVKGHKRGRIIGYPTANIDPHHEVIPPSGVYAAKIKFKNKIYNGILNIGVRPTFKKHRSKDVEPTIEVHIFNFNKFIYGKELEIAFVRKIRKEKKFKNTLQLRRQIKKDDEKAHHILR